MNDTALRIVVNRHPVQDAPVETELLPDGEPFRGPLECTVWEPLLPDVSARNFRLRQTVLTPDGRGAVRLTLPPGGFARLGTKEN